MIRGVTALLLAFFVLATASPAQARHRHHRSHHHPTRIHLDANGSVVGRRPSGCPHAFCGCEASLYLFGRIKPELNLAANWIRKFPHTSAAPGMAAARNHHVMVLLHRVEGNNWFVHDGNSGGGLTREHVVSISGYIIVNPRGSRHYADSGTPRIYYY